MLESLASPGQWLQQLAPDLTVEGAAEYERFWREQGQAISDAVDRAGTPHLRMFDALGRRVDDVQYPPEYWTALAEGYRAGVVWRAFDEKRSLVPSFVLGYLTSFFDPGIYCPYTVSLSTAVPLEKYGSPEITPRFLGRMLDRSGRPWQGATWMTESGGGSDLGAGVLTTARAADDDVWLLTGDKYFCSNIGADLAVVAARPADAQPGIRGLRLFLVPRLRRDGALNYVVRRLKDKIATRSVPTGEVELRDAEAYVLGTSEPGIYLILEVLNISRVANSVGSAALAQRATADAVAFARERVAFGKPIAGHPLLARQIEARCRLAETAGALAWEAVRQLDSVRSDRPPYPARYDMFRLTAHLAKYWTAEIAAQTAKWAIEVFGGVGTLAENRVERWLREALILGIWEGTPHRQMLDALEVMERKRAHHLLLERLRPLAAAEAIDEWKTRLDALLARPRDEREADIESVFPEFAKFTARALASDLRQPALNAEI